MAQGTYFPPPPEGGPPARLKLVACSLSLAACGLIIFFIFLVFAITDTWNIPVPALPTASAFIALLRAWTAVVFGRHSTGPGPAFDWALVYHMRGHTNN